MNEPNTQPIAETEKTASTPIEATEPENVFTPAEPENAFTPVESAEPEKSFCVNCGVELAFDQQVCPKCGQKVGMPLSATNTKSSFPNKKKAIFLGVIVIGIIALIGIICTSLLGKQAQSITLNKSEISIKVGETASLTFTINPIDTKDQTATWISSNESIAQVSNGTITGINEGDCIITATTKNGKTDTCAVTILAAGPNLTELYNKHCSSDYAEIASDGSYLSIDTNPSDEDDYNNYEAILALPNLLSDLGLPDSVYEHILSTSSSDGRQTHSTSEINITWKYHPDKGLELIISLAQSSSPPSAFPGGLFCAIISHIKPTIPKGAAP